MLDIDGCPDASRFHRLALIVLAGDTEFAHGTRSIIIDLPHFIDCGFELVQSGLESIAVVDRNLVLPGRINDEPILGVQRRDAGRVLRARTGR